MLIVILLRIYTNVLNVVKRSWLTNITPIDVGLHVKLMALIFGLRPPLPPKSIFN